MNLLCFGPFACERFKTKGIPEGFPDRLRHRHSNQEEAGQKLAGPELVAFALGLAGQKLLNDIAQIHTLTSKAINLLLMGIA